MVLELIRDLGIFAGVIGLIAFLGKRWIDNYFNKQEQDFQGEVDKELQRFQSELDKELQRVQTELEKEQIIFSGLHEQRAEIVSELYAKMGEFDEDMRAVVRPYLENRDELMEENIDAAAESGEEFRRFYKKNKIYFPSEICKTAELLLSKYSDMFNKFAIFRVHDQENSPLDANERLDTWVENWNSLTENEVPELREELEDHFRELLGVDTEMRLETEVGEKTEVEEAEEDLEAEE